MRTILKGRRLQLELSLIIPLLPLLPLTTGQLVDLDPACGRLTSLGDCDESPEWMVKHCTRSCLSYYETAEPPSDDPEENRDVAEVMSARHYRPPRKHESRSADLLQAMQYVH